MSVETEQHHVVSVEARFFFLTHQFAEMVSDSGAVCGTACAQLQRYVFIYEGLDGGIQDLILFSACLSPEETLPPALFWRLTFINNAPFDRVLLGLTQSR